MDHDLLKTVIFDQHEIIRNASIVPRRYTFEPQANYVITGLRRAGKSTLLYKVARDLVDAGASWEQILYVNFEDERLVEFSTADFADIVLVQNELSDKPGYFFFDEVQNIPHWEKFARRLADAGERVYITGSNSTMLSGEIATTLGGRYFIKHITPYRFDEYLDACRQEHRGNALYLSKNAGRIASLFDRFYQHGGFPESLHYNSPREYVESVYQKVLLGDIAARNKVRNVNVLRVLMKKVAETVRSDVSYSTLHNTLKSIGFSVGKDTVISYIALAKEAYLLFSINNFAKKFVERESNSKYYFSDNGLLSLFLHDKDTALLENEVAVALRDRYGEELWYLRSAKTGVDVDFYLPEQKLAVQVAYSISGTARQREVGNLSKLAKEDTGIERFVIVTKEEQGTIEEDSIVIEVVPCWKFLLDLA